MDLKLDLMGKISLCVLEGCTVRRFIIVAGALAVSKLGSQESMPTKTDIEEFLTEVKLK